MKKYSDKAILTGIRDRKDSILEYLYRDYYPQVLRIIVKNGGDKQDARDLFQEALIVIFNRLKKNELIIESSFHSYFISLCKFIWFQQVNQKGNFEIAYQEEKVRQPSVVEERDGNKAFEEYLNNQMEKIYQRHFRKLPGDCKRVLRMFFKRRSYTEISQKMRYAGEDYARRKKYLCMQRLLAMINEDPEYHELKRRAGK